MLCLYTSKGIVTNREFWKKMKLFLTNKDCLDKSELLLGGDNEIITDDKSLANFLVSIILTLQNRPVALNQKKQTFTMKILIREYYCIILLKSTKIILASTTRIKNSVSVKIHMSSNHTLLSARPVTSNEVKSILKSLSTKKVPTKHFRLASNFLSKSQQKLLITIQFHLSFLTQLKWLLSFLLTKDGWEIRYI